MVVDCGLWLVVRMGGELWEKMQRKCSTFFTFSSIPCKIPCKINVVCTVLGECTRGPWEKLNGPHGTTRDLWSLQNTCCSHPLPSSFKCIIWQGTSNIKGSWTWNILSRAARRCSCEDIFLPQKNMRTFFFTQKNMRTFFSPKKHDDIFFTQKKTWGHFLTQKNMRTWPMAMCYCLCHSVLLAIPLQQNKQWTLPRDFPQDLQTWQFPDHHLSGSPTHSLLFWRDFQV